MPATFNLQLPVAVHFPHHSTLFAAGTAFTIRTSMCWVLPPLINSWIRLIISLYIALNMTPIVDLGAGPKVCVPFPNICSLLGLLPKAALEQIRGCGAGFGVGSALKVCEFRV